MTRLRNFNYIFGDIRTNYESYVKEMLSQESISLAEQAYVSKAWAADQEERGKFGELKPIDTVLPLANSSWFTMFEHIRGARNAAAGLVFENYGNVVNGIVDELKIHDAQFVNHIRAFLFKTLGDNAVFTYNSIPGDCRLSFEVAVDSFAYHLAMLCCFYRHLNVSELFKSSDWPRCRCITAALLIQNWEKLEA